MSPKRTRPRLPTKTRPRIGRPVPARPIPVTSEAVGRDPYAESPSIHLFGHRESKYLPLMEALEASLDESGVSAYIFMAEEAKGISWRSRLNAWARERGLSVRQTWYDDAAALDTALAGQSGHVVWTVPSSWRSEQQEAV